MATPGRRVDQLPTLIGRLQYRLHRNAAERSKSDGTISIHRDIEQKMLKDNSLGGGHENEINQDCAKRRETVSPKVARLGL